MLAASAGRAVDLHLDVLRPDLDLHILRQVGHDLHRGEGGLPPGVGIKWRYPHQAVDTVLSPEVAVGVLPLDHNGGRLDARLVTVLIVHDLIGKAVALRPAGVHPIEHLGPVLGLRATSAGVDGQDDVGAVVLAGQQGLEARLLHVPLQLGKALLQLRHQGLVLKLISHLAQSHQVVPLLTALVLLIHLVLEGLDALLYLLCFFQIIPKSIGSRLRLEHIQLPFRPLQIQGLAQLLQGGSQIIQLDLIFVELKHNGPHSHSISVIENPNSAQLLYPKPKKK